jgi:opacity protein-like surface antigen
MRASTAIAVSSIALVAGLAGSVPAAAGSFGVEAQGGYHSLSASQSAKAVFDGSTGGATFGGALRYVLYKGFYIAGGARTFTKSGERVYVAASGSPVAKLGFPLDVRITPIFGTLGYRFREGRSLVPYLGVGGGVTSFKETSDVTGDVREESRSKSSFQALVGLEYGTGMIRFGAEGVYSSTPDSIGVGGVSKVYGEKDIGGFSILGKLILSFGK